MSLDISFFDSYGLMGLIRLLFSYLMTKIKHPSARLIRYPTYIRGSKYIKIGKGFTTGVGCRFDAFSKQKNIVIEFGDDVQINDYVHIGAVESVRIGSRSLLASNIFISDHNHGCYSVGSKISSPLTPPIHRELSSAPVLIEEDVWIGEYVSILPGVTIGKGSIIGAGSVVTKNISSYTIAAGNPARVIKVYDFKKEQWERPHDGTR